MNFSGDYMNNIKKLSKLSKLSNHVSVYQNGMSCTVIEKNGAACLISCNLQITPQKIDSLDLDVKLIICLNYRSSINGGMAKLAKPGIRLAAPAGQVHLFESPAERLKNEKFRLHVYDFHPDNDIITDSVNIDEILSDGMILDFEGIKIEFFELKGDTDGELGCVIHDDIEIGVCGDSICDDGKIPFLYRLCKDSGNLDDYHAFLFDKDDLIDSLHKFNDCDIVIPARGEIITAPQNCVKTLERRLCALYENYSSASALNYYVPGYLKPNMPMTPAKTIPTPSNIKYLFCNYIIISENKRGFLIDCGTNQGLDLIEPLFQSGELEGIDICYITHYHHDHVDMLDKLQELYNCEIYAPSSFSDMLENPEAYYMTCLSHVGISPKVLPDNYSFTWEGYNFTNFEFPGQSLYHGGLLFDDGNSRILFCGDSFAPTGFDDYCPQNRNFIGQARGYHKCLDIIENLKPDCIINQHQEKAFVYTQAEIEYLRNNLKERYGLLGDLTMWDSPDYSLDPYWVRMYPYVSRIEQGEACVKELQFTNHKNAPAHVTVKFNASKGIVVPEDIDVTLAPLTSGLVNQAPADIRIPVTFFTDKTDKTDKIKPKTYAIGAEVWLDGVYFGQICKSLIFADLEKEK